MKKNGFNKRPEGNVKLEKNNSWNDSGKPRRRWPTDWSR